MITTKNTNTITDKELENIDWYTLEKEQIVEIMDKMTAEQFDHCVQNNTEVVLFCCSDKLNAAQLNFCVHEAPKLTLNKCHDRLSPEQLDFLVHKEPSTTLEKCHDRLSPEQFNYCVRKGPLYALKYCPDKLSEEQKKYCDVHMDDAIEQFKSGNMSKELLQFIFPTKN